LVEITPVEFPNGLPKPEDFDPKCVKVTHDGKFLVHPMLGQESNALLEQGQVKVRHIMLREFLTKIRSVA
jgi:hypothetical protein